MITYTMRDGRNIPAIGYGTYPMSNAEAEDNVAEAIMRGHRLIDTAAQYGNEEGVGRGVANSGVDREDIFVTSKLAGKDHGFDSAVAAVKESLRVMGLEYLDLYLIHWPNPQVNLYVESWKALIAMKEEGLIRSIGTSNFLPEHIDRLGEETSEIPVVNQIELQVRQQQEKLRAYHAQKKIVTQAWSPLGRMKNLEEMPELGDIADTIGVTPAQVVLRWMVQNHIVPIPKTSTPARMEENLNVFDWELSAEQMDTIKLLHTGIGYKDFDPRTHEEF
ncbi:MULTISPECIES: aldo/keto reductase [Kocuria]|uniref:aldo/keto reductase n=1 Tax=Kocuria TaxID=57493 RepID=UPI00066047DE|nr:MULTISPECIES: aldo/keto reductase [Kocuria]MCT1367866.1 aldo/keto reductase [Rothia sp. p3-SID1597]RUQ21142.1 aldo/keto reductase [Kocuria sp. HSID16901]